MKKRVTGIGGVFFKCKDPKKTREWYDKHLGLSTDDYGTNFEWRKTDKPEEKGFTQWSPFSNESTFFEDQQSDFMINFRVENIEELVKTLRNEGVVVIDEIETFDYGKFVHILDNEGKKIQLWEPEDSNYDQIVEGRTF
ncbi:MAG: VOC family protein [Brumimicrobium sp.]|nr:VOC family protein [Brumimicrobium sp.]